MCTVKPYRILNERFRMPVQFCVRLSRTVFLNERFRTFCRKASLPFLGEWTWGCGITFDIFTHVLHGFYTSLL